jgi:hypothetical protein
MDWSWTVIAAVLVTYVHVFTHVANAYLDSDRTMGWQNVIHTWIPHMEVTIKV